MKKSPSLPARNIRDMAAGYRFDYSKAKPNRFAEKMNVGWTVERNGKKENGKTMSMNRRKPAVKKPKAAPKAKKSGPKKPAAKAKPAT